MSGRENPRILCVDDEQRVLEGLALSLRRDYRVLTALSGDEGLKILRELRGDVAVVVSDMRMPGMNGATFLQHVMKVSPSSARILLTGEPGRDTAIDAINRGQIFRFLTKPCAPDDLKTAIDAGVMQFRLATAERSIMQETLMGCIHALIDVLSITNPVAFGRASRAKKIALSFAASLKMEGFWQLEAATMLSQLGYLSLPVELVEKVYYGEPLSEEEKALASGATEVAVHLLEHIPRLEPVMQILNALNWTDEQIARLGEGTIGHGTRILALVLEYDTMIMQGNASDVAIQTLRRRSSRFGVDLVEQFATHIGAGLATGELREMQLRAVQAGMTILQDVRSQMGVLLVPRGFEVTEVFMDRIRKFGADLLNQTVKVRVPVTTESAAQAAGNG